VPNKKTTFFLFLCSLFSSTFCLAEPNDLSKHPLYFGAIAGYGSTTWKGLVPKEDDNSALMLATPIKVEEGGSVSGGVVGYEFNAFFALEASYMHFPDSDVYFDSMSLFSFFHDNLEILTTKTETASLMAKLMIPVFHTQMRLFSSFGVAGVHRKDIIINNWHPGPTFSVGLNYRFAEHIMGELAGNFTAGYGESQLSPVDSYYPFFYSIATHLIYRF
jgi:hypothetical protein